MEIVSFKTLKKLCKFHQTNTDNCLAHDHFGTKCNFKDCPFGDKMILGEFIVEREVNDDTVTDETCSESKEKERG